MSDRRTFLALLLFNAVFLSALVVAARFYHGGLHPAAVTAIAVILLVYAGATARALRLAWRYAGDAKGYISLAIRVLPMIAILGTATGFLIAFSGGVDDVQQRVAGASTGIVSTIVGVACTVALMLQRHILDEV